jgi:hypothetical protein
MIYKNGYKVVYEIAADGKRTFWASKSNEYPTRDEAGNIIENEMNTKLASFVDTDFAGKTIYEYEGEFYVADTIAAKFDKDGKPTGDRLVGLNDTNFDKILVEEETPTNDTPVDADKGADAGDDDMGNDDLDLEDEGGEE